MSSDFLDDLINKAKTRTSDLWDETGAGTPVPIEPTEANAIQRDSFDKLGWDMLVDQTPVLRQHRDDLAGDFETSPPAYEDLFNLLHQGDPRFTPAGEMLDTHKPQHSMLEQMASGDEMTMLRRETRYDEYNTAFALSCMKDDIRQAFEDLQDAIDAAQQAQQDMQDALQGAEQAQGSGQGQDAAAAALQAALDASDAAQQAGQEAVDGTMEQMRQSVREAREDIREEKDAMNGWGVDPGQLQQMSYEERRALVERLDSDRLRMLAAMLGAWRPYADAERRRKVKHMPEQVVNITMGNDLTKLTPGELTNLAVPELEDQFWIRWARHGLLQQELEGVDKAGHGPVIVVVDESGTMGSAVDGTGNTREAWSKAVSLSLLDAAKRDGRDFIYIGFSSASQQWRLDFPGGQASIDSMIKLAEHFYSGGTSYVEPLTMAMDVVRAYDAAGKSKPDIVFITDDNCRVTPEFIQSWHEMKTKADVACYGVQIGGDPYSNNLKDLSDNCVSLSKLNAGPEGMQHVFRNI